MDLIKKNILDHFKFLAEKSGADIFKINDVEIINFHLNSSDSREFNTAFGLPSHKNFLNSIQKIKQIFEYQSFCWYCDYNNEFHKMILENGFSIVEEYEMICDLSKKTHNSLQTQTNLVIKQVLCNETLEDFINIMEINYKGSRIIYKKFTLKDFQEKFFVGYFYDEPVSTASLFISDNSCGIFNVFTKNEYRKKGFRTDMMVRLMSFAKDSGCKFAILIATLKGYKIYKRLGFSKSGELKVYEFK